MPRPAPRPIPTSTPRRPPAEPPPIVSGRWLLTAFLITLAAAAVCGYGTLCLLFYQGQWQMLFHPSRTITATPETAGLAWNDIRFDVTDAGVPRLEGWWIPAAAGSPYTADTILYLHNATGSLSDTVPTLVSLHALGINVFAIDYRGFGRSTGAHPTERTARDDARAAWTYLTDTRHIAAGAIVIFGDGTGATFAAHLAAAFAPAGVVLEDVNAPAQQVFATDARTRMLPLFLLQKERLDPTGDLAQAKAPKLFLDRGKPGAPPPIPARPDRTRQLFESAAYPREYFDLRSAPPAALTATLRRFLDGVLR